MIRIALCTPMSRAEPLRLRIASAVLENVPIIDILDAEDMVHALQSPTSYDAFWVAIDGAVGMEVVIAIKEYDPTIPVVWMSEDKQFAAIAYNLRVASFLSQDCMVQEIATALRAIKNDRRDRNEKYMVLS